MNNPVKVLRIDASGRTDQSSTRTLTDNLLDALQARYSTVEVARRDLAEGIPHVDQDWITANFTAEDERNAGHQQQLSYSDRLVDELKDAEVIVIGVPIYNFGVPAALIVAVGLLVLWVLNRPKPADFLIATEGEMKKVSWSSKEELIGSTAVVIVTVIILAVLIYVADFIWTFGLVKVGVLPSQ